MMRMEENLTCLSPNSAHSAPLLIRAYIASFKLEYSLKNYKVQVQKKEKIEINMKLYPILITLLNSKEILDTEEKVLRYIRSVDEGDAQEVFHSETEYRIGNGFSKNP